MAPSVQWLVTCLSSRTLALELGHAVEARGAVVARLTGAVVDVDAAVRARPAVDADAVEVADLVEAGATVETYVRPKTLVHVLSTVPS